MLCVYLKLKIFLKINVWSVLFYDSCILSWKFDSFYPLPCDVGVKSFRWIYYLYQTLYDLFVFSLLFKSHFRVYQIVFQNYISLVLVNFLHPPNYQIFAVFPPSIQQFLCQCDSVLIFEGILIWCNGISYQLYSPKHVSFSLVLMFFHFFAKLIQVAVCVFLQSRFISIFRV